MGEYPDDPLVQQAKQGDVKAFMELANRYQQKIYNTVFSLTKNHQDTDDLAQETFMQAFKSMNQFKRQSRFSTWLYRIAVNLTLNFLKKKSRERGRDFFDDRISLEAKVVAINASPERSSLHEELLEKLHEAVDSLALPYKTSFILVVFQGMSHAQAAQILSCSEKTVSWRIHKARKMLQARLRPFLEGVRE